MSLIPHRPLLPSDGRLSVEEQKRLNKLGSRPHPADDIDIIKRRLKADMDEEDHRSISPSVVQPEEGKSYDKVLFDVLRVSPEDFASQITLMDHEVFLRIKPDEFSSCSWSTRQKHQITPNIVAFTKRFNQVNFWVQKSVLEEPTAAVRADVMAHFIKIAKQCYSLNNLHAVMAIISALQSASIFRLSRTWSNLSKRDRSSYEKMSELFSETNNRQKLREYMDSVRLPVIPYLGLYLNDLTYIDVAHPYSGGMETDMRRTKMNNILRLISEYQCSKYSLPVLKHIQSYLSSQHYIEELQKFIEDDNYKASLRLEPATSNSSLETDTSGSYAPLPPPVASSRDDLPLSRTSSGGASGGVGSSSVASSTSSASAFVPRHRKSKSLGTSMLTPADYEKTQSLPAPGGAGGRAAPSPGHHLLIDDSIADGEEGEEAGPSERGTLINSRPGRGRSVIFKKPDLAGQLLGCGLRSMAIDEDGPRVALPSPTAPLWGGCLKRKTVLKRGKKPRLNKWKKYWIQVWGSNLLYFPERKSGAGAEGDGVRADFKADPSKMVSVMGWMVVLCDDPSQPDAFQLSCERGHVYKFLAGSRTQALEWVRRISRATGATERKTPENLISFHD